MAAHPLMLQLGERLSSGLKRKSITTVSKWSEMYRVMGGKSFPGAWTTNHHPWLKEMQDCPFEMVIGQKAAQMGYTEIALNKALKTLDIDGDSVLYVLPASTPDAKDFSSARFDPALELSDHLRNLFSDTKNVGHKRAGNGSLYIRGSRSRNQMKSLPVALIIFDEVDEMNQKNVTLALERTSGQMHKQAMMISTPTISKFGINGFFESSTQSHFFFKCPHCSKRVELTFPECIVITSDDYDSVNIRDTYIICPECKHKLSHEGKYEYLSTGIWVDAFTDRLSKGYHINQMYSSTVKPYELATLYLKSMTNPEDEQEFFNSKLGLPHAVDGAQVTDEHIENCMAGYKKISIASHTVVTTLGVDVGKYLHCEVDQWVFNRQAGEMADVSLRAHGKLLNELKIEHFESLDKLMMDFNINFCVIDANPEKRKAKEFAQRFFGIVRLCYYGNAVNGKEIHLHNEEECTMTVDRTSWLDVSLGRIQSGKMDFPVDLSMEYRTHIKSLVRVYEKDVNDNPVGRYVKGNDDDHFAHARNYSELALQLAVHISGARDIAGVL